MPLLSVHRTFLKKSSLNIYCKHLLPGQWSEFTTLRHWSLYLLLLCYCCPLRCNGHLSYKVPGQLRTWYWKVALSEIDVCRRQFIAWNLTVLMLSQRQSWSFQSSGTWSRVLGRVVTDVSKGSFYLHLLGWVWNPSIERSQLPISKRLTSKAFKSFILTHFIEVYVNIYRNVWLNLNMILRGRNVPLLECWSQRTASFHKWNASNICTRQPYITTRDIRATAYLQKASLSLPHMPHMCLIRGSAYGFIIYKCRSTCRYEHHW
jgi:hypothetical protein